MKLNMMTGEHRQLAGRGVLLVFCHIHDTGTRRLEVRDAENLAIHLEDGGEVRVVGHQVDLPNAEMAMSIIALCAGRASTATAKLSDIAQASVIVPLPPEAEYSFAAVPSCWTTRPALFEPAQTCRCY